MKDYWLYVVKKTNVGREFQFLEVIGINELVNAFVQLVTNLTRKGCLLIENRVFLAHTALDGIIDFISSGQKQ